MSHELKGDLIERLMTLSALEPGWYANVGAKTGEACCQAMREAAAELSRLQEENAAARPWVLFYRDGKTLGEVAAECGGSIYSYSPWLTAPLVRAALSASQEQGGAEHG